MAFGTTKSTADQLGRTAKCFSPSASGKRPKTPDGCGMSAGTTNLADHLRNRCEEIGLQVLAEALDRLETPLEEDVSEQAMCPVDGPLSDHRACQKAAA